MKFTEIAAAPVAAYYWVRKLHWLWKSLLVIFGLLFLAIWATSQQGCTGLGEFAGEQAGILARMSPEHREKAPRIDAKILEVAACLTCHRAPPTKDWSGAGHPEVPSGLELAAARCRYCHPDYAPVPGWAPVTAASPFGETEVPAWEPVKRQRVP